MHPALDTTRPWLRPWRAEDAADFLRLAQDPDVLRYANEGVACIADQARAFVERQVTKLASRGYCRWALVSRDDGAFAGLCGGESADAVGDVEIGRWIVRHRWGARLATEAARAACRDRRARVTLPRVVSLAHRDNTPSNRILQRLGLVVERAFEYHRLPCVLYASREGTPDATLRYPLQADVA